VQRTGEKVQVKSQSAIFSSCSQDKLQENGGLEKQCGCCRVRKLSKLLFLYHHTTSEGTLIQSFTARKPWIFRSIYLVRYKRGRKNSIEFLVLSVIRDERNHVCVITLSIRWLSYKLPPATVGVYVKEILERRGFKEKDGIATEVLQWFRQKHLYIPQTFDNSIFGIFLVLKHKKIRWLHLVTKIYNIFKGIIKNSKRLLKLYS